MNVSVNAVDVSHNESDVELGREWLYFSSRVKLGSHGVEDGLAALIGEDKSCSLEFSRAFVKMLAGVHSKDPASLFFMHRE